MLEILKSKSMVLFVLLVFGFTFIGGISNNNQEFEQNENIQIVIE